MVSQYDEGPEEEREREEDYRRERAISQILIEAGVIISNSSDEKETFDEGPTITFTEDNAEPTSSIAKKKRKLYIEKVETQIDPLPSENGHIRSSERKVRDDLYKTVANLFGYP